MTETTSNFTGNDLTEEGLSAFRRRRIRVGANPHPPKLLYKYRFANAYLWETLRNRTIYLPSPTEFNDPFDCAPLADTAFDAAVVKKYGDRWLKEFKPGATRQERRSRTRSLLKTLQKNEAHLELDARLATALRTVTAQAGIYSMSELPDDVLMWSHYADSHRGVCLAFNAHCESPFAFARKVEYRAERPQIQPFTGPQDEWINLAFLRKADYWSYEKEWRVIYRQQKLESFPATALMGIILGAKAPPKTEREIKAAVSGMNSSIRFFRAEFDPKLFRIHVREI